LLYDKQVQPKVVKAVPVQTDCGLTAQTATLHVAGFKSKLEIWGKAQRESARRPKSDWREIRGRV